MPEWVSAAEIVEQYAVSEARLLEYSARGNLPCRRGGGAEAAGDADHEAVYFDLAYVARIFRLRSASDVVASAGHAGQNEQSRGPTVLGRVVLGQKLVKAPIAAR